jgi:hypothetical protein
VPQPDYFNPTSTYALTMNTGPQQDAQCEVYGQWIVHCTCGLAALRHPYTVTHVPTGMSVARDLELDNARALAGQLGRVPIFHKAEGREWLAALPVLKEVLDGQQVFRLVLP